MPNKLNSPVELRRSGLVRWRNRLLPAGSQGAWRGRAPRLSSQQSVIYVTSLRQGVLLKTNGSTVVAWLYGSLWSTLVPLTPLAGRRLQETLAPRVQQLWAYLLRGLGGLCRLKLRYKGKSFKWHRRRGALALRFGHAHLVAIRPIPGVRWRRFGRMKIVLFGSNAWDLLSYAQAVCWWRPMNVYHGRGLRLRRQLVLRKAGKVSAYR